MILNSNPEDGQMIFNVGHSIAYKSRDILKVDFLRHHRFTFENFAQENCQKKTLNMLREWV